MIAIDIKLEDLRFNRGRVNYVFLQKGSWFRVNYAWVIHVGIGDADFVVYGSNDREECVRVLQEIEHDNYSIGVSHWH